MILFETPLFQVGVGCTAEEAEYAARRSLESSAGEYNPSWYNNLGNASYLSSSFYRPSPSKKKGATYKFSCFYYKETRFINFNFGGGTLYKTVCPSSQNMVDHYW